jgi:hypothetical protein
VISLNANQPLLSGQFYILIDEFNDQAAGVVPDNVHNVFEEQLFHLEGAVFLLSDCLQVLTGGTEVLLKVASEVHFYGVYGLKDVFSFRSYAET